MICFGKLNFFKVGDEFLSDGSDLSFFVNEGDFIWSMCE